MRFTSLVLAAFMLVGCGGGGSSGPEFLCPLAHVVPFPGTMINPPNGATGVPTTIASFTFTVAGDPAGFAGGIVRFDPANSAARVTAQPIAVSGSVYTVSVSGLAPQTTYMVSAVAPPFTHDACGDNVGAAATLGSFTTQ